MPDILMTDAELAERKKRMMQFFEDYRNGHFLLELADAFEELTEASQRAGKAGTVTIAFGMRPLGDDGSMEIGDTITVKAPKLAKGTCIMFASPNGELTRSDPRQKEISLKALPKQDEQPKTLRVVPEQHKTI